MATTLGISPNYEGLRIVNGNNSYFFPPSSFAEAVIGGASEVEVKAMLDSVTVDALHSKSNLNLPSLEAFLLSQHGDDPWSELEEAVMKHHEGVKNLLRRRAILEEKNSPLDISRGGIKRRGNASRQRDRHTSARGYKLIGAELPPEYNISCDCDPFRFSTGKAQYRKNDPTTTHLVCYHVAAHLYYLSTDKEGVFLPFDFRKRPELVMESFVMRKVFNRDYAEVDRFLLNSDVLTEQAMEMVRKKKAAVEVLKSQYEFGEAWRIIYGLEDYIRGREYHYKGFATNFPNRSEQTIGIVYEKEDGALHILFDQKTWKMPFLVEKVPVHMFRGNHVVSLDEPLLQNLGVWFSDYDVRTQLRMVSRVMLPPNTIDVLMTLKQYQEYEKLRSQ